MRPFALLLLASLFFPAAAGAQSVPIKTIPVAEGAQFLFFPSERLAMGGVGIALEDRYADPFVNPAKAVNVTGVRFVSSPVYYGFGPLNGDGGEGSGRTLPVGAMMHRNQVFGGVMMAYQELSRARADACCFFEGVGGDVLREGSDFSLNNLYVMGMGGVELPGGAWSVGVGAFYGGLEGLEGVQRLYSDDALSQDGSLQQYRVGIYRKGGDGHAADLVLLHHRFDMTHTIGEGQEPRKEYDRTQSVALQGGYRYEFPTGWSMGARLAGDWKWHPKIPNYDLMNIPRDPGNSAAYNIGIGLATMAGAATFGFDLIFEPIWSHTWANAAEPVETANGETIPEGQKTVDNRFDFQNARVRMGVHHEGEKVDLALGIDMHHISYDLDQTDFVDAQRRLLDQGWTEWTLSGGIGADLSSFRLQYAARLTLGTGRPGVQRPWTWLEGDFAAAEAGFSSDWVAAPDGPLTLEETKVLTHQLSLLIPLAE